MNLHRSFEETAIAEEKLRTILDLRKARDIEQTQQQRQDRSEEYAGELMEDEIFKRCAEFCAFFPLGQGSSSPTKGGFWLSIGVPV